MATNQTVDEVKDDAAKRARAIELKKQQDAAEAANKERTGVGTRVFVGQTRGKASQVVSWEAFDDSKPETLPKSMKEFMDTTKLTAESDLLGLLIVGYNDAQYTAASDPIAEYVENVWPADAQSNFRLVVRNYSRGATVPIEEAVKLIKPGFVAQYGTDAEPKTA